MHRHEHRHDSLPTANRDPHHHAAPRRGPTASWISGALFGLALALGCAGDGDSPPAKPAFDPPAEYVAFQFDGREWTPGSQKRIGRVIQEIYVLPGETVDEWTELVTRTLALGAQRGTTIGALLEAQRKQLEEACPIVEFETLSQEARSSLYEWSRPQCKELQPQTQIARTIFGRLGVHTLTYTAKSARIAPGLRKRWLETLRTAELEVRKQGQ